MHILHSCTHRIKIYVINNIQLIFRCATDLLHTDLFCFNISNHWVLVYTSEWQNYSIIENYVIHQIS